MRNLARITLSVSAAALFAGCGGSQRVGLPGAIANAVPGKSAIVYSASVPASYRVVYSFHGSDGSRPLGNLIALNGLLYGTTSEGGKHGIAPKDGVVFSMTTSGKEQVLHDFGATHDDGTYPMAGPIEIKGTLYGTTGLGNPSNTGTVYSVTTSGNERVIYSFGEFGPSGLQPSANLIAVHGILYSTTNFGGQSGLGIVFRVATDGTEKTVHSFGHPYRTDGQIPASRLLNMNGTLYGTTYEGGIYGRERKCSGASCPGYGTVFSISTSGKARVIHSFGNGSDGVYPVAGLTQVKGVLYGTTTQGGTYDCGTIFSITTAGAEHILHNFDGSTGDGCQPSASLIALGGTLYGTTAYGGAYNRGGTAFSIETTGSGEHVLHSFGSGSDGKNPVASLRELNGTFYGTTESGGANGHGAVFALTP